MRGKVPQHLADKVAERITPAYAGKSCTLYEDAKACEDHPRLCGEKVSL